jgi:hypothetical protein
MQKNAAEKKRQSASWNEPQSEARKQLIFVVEVLLVLVILFMLPKLVMTAGRHGTSNRKRNDLQTQSLLTNCQAHTCSSFVPEEGLNCVLACVSPACYGVVYGTDPLEDGEVDISRASQFESCLKEELRTLRIRRKQRFV